MTSQISSERRSAVHGFNRLRLAVLAGVVTGAQLAIPTSAQAAEAPASSASTAAPAAALADLVTNPEALAAGLAAPPGAQGVISSSATIGAIDETVATSTAPVATDPFSRTLDGGWGEPASGGSYTLSNPADFSVNGSHGIVSLDAGGQSDSATLPAVSMVDTEASVQVSLKALPTDGLGTYASVVVRAQNNFGYRGTLRIGPDGAAVHLAARRFADQNHQPDGGVPVAGQGGCRQFLPAEVRRHRHIPGITAGQGVAVVGN